MKYLIDQPERVRTTVDLPRELFDRSRSVVDRKLAKNQNALFTAALAEYLDQLDQQIIDNQFAEMVTDSAYQDLSLDLVNEFSGADRTAQAARDGAP